MKSTGALNRTVRQIETGISEGRWLAGERLPAERALAESLGVSRATVREAIGRLVSKGLLESRHGSGVYLLGNKPVGTAAPWMQLIAETPPLRSETLEFRMVFECAAARFAAQRASAQQVERFEGILSACRRPCGRPMSTRKRVPIANSTPCSRRPRTTACWTSSMPA
ncbi:FadR/GntR family transcriptional regulator [Burkholderia gladioli]|uniref:FadR/GntR family transcriptional regulator n=1 Tax=Burkholderia gladioli TaxID=28095 RepID=UPI003EDF42B5